MGRGDVVGLVVGWIEGLPLGCPLGCPVGCPLGCPEGVALAAATAAVWIRMSARTSYHQRHILGNNKIVSLLASSPLASLNLFLVVVR